ncbi:hypothetical protein MNBD_GAMMA23-1318 [hydrothermal vent metagenome]|uniref:HMA domain-containing protein n=1 Tax=hydrothermal vent metagenome TaxID=652676 RepID=A0A3B1AS08_9ZZZZ
MRIISFEVYGMIYPHQAEQLEAELNEINGISVRVSSDSHLVMITSYQLFDLQLVIDIIENHGFETETLDVDFINGNELALSGSSA